MQSKMVKQRSHYPCRELVCVSTLHLWCVSDSALISTDAAARWDEEKSRPDAGWNWEVAKTEEPPLPTSGMLKPGTGDFRFRVFLGLGYFQGPPCIDCCILIRYSGFFADIFISNLKKMYWTFQLDDDWNVQYIFKYEQRLNERSLKQTYQGKGLFYEL